MAGRLPDDRIARLKTAPDWPKVVQRSRGQSAAACLAKGEPHFATLITSEAMNEGDGLGNLEIRWCVFFPVGKQPPGGAHLKLHAFKQHITINLHGFFFLDSDRLRIDGLEDKFSPNPATGNKACLEWNRIVATEGTLACLPEALALFARNEHLTNTQCRELSDALRKTSLWSAFQDAVCLLGAWRPRWR